MARLLDAGRGVKPDPSKAAQCYLRAAAKGHADAATRLGLMTFAGRGVKQNDREAGRWLLQGAERGNTEAQVNVGVMLYKGRGGKVDLVEAYLWLNLAANNGSPLAKKVVAEVLEEMTDTQIAKGKTYYNDWIERHPLLAPPLPETDPGEPIRGDQKPLAESVTAVPGNGEKIEGLAQPDSAEQVAVGEGENAETAPASEDAEIEGTSEEKNSGDPKSDPDDGGAETG
jgi:TPR repeat protein